MCFLLPTLWSSIFTSFYFIFIKPPVLAAAPDSFFINPHHILMGLICTPLIYYLIIFYIFYLLILFLPFPFSYFYRYSLYNFPLFANVYFCGFFTPPTLPIFLISNFIIFTLNLLSSLQLQTINHYKLLMPSVYYIHSICILVSYTFS